MKNKGSHYELFSETVKIYAEKGASDKELFTLFLSLSANYLAQILDILEEDKEKNDTKTAI